MTYYIVGQPITEAILRAAQLITTALGHATLERAESQGIAIAIYTVTDT